MTPHAASAAAAVILALPAFALAQPVPTMWAENCASCHGADGKGGGAGAQSLLDTNREWLGGTSDRDLFNSIKLGLKDHGMPAYAEALKDGQTWSLVVYIRELQARAKRPARVPSKAEAGTHQTQHVAYTLQDVVPEGTLQVPWAIDWLPDGTMLITERPGRVRTFKDGTLSEPITNVPTVRARGQGGMMDVAVHPDFAKNGWVYLSFSDKIAGRGTPGMTKVVRGHIKDGAWTDEQTIFKADDKFYLPSDIHFGCKLVFEPAREPGKWYLFFGIGERGYGQYAQVLERANGKVHRVWDDGSIPDDNPFLSDSTAIKSAWSFGHRNPQGLVRDLQGRLWDTEHGPRGGDELNLIQKGHNYGWPIVSFGMDYPGIPLRQALSKDKVVDVVPFPDLVLPENKPSVEITMPEFVWLPSIAASGLDVVRPGSAGEAFPMWKGDLIAGGLAGETVQRLRLDAQGHLVEREELVRGQGRVRDVAIGPDGAVYLALNDPDKIVRLVPGKVTPKADASPPSSPGK